MTKDACASTVNDDAFPMTPFRACPEAVREIRQMARAAFNDVKCLDEDAYTSFGLVLSEGVANAIKHGSPPRQDGKEPIIWVGFRRNGNRMEARIRDTGRGFDVGAAYRAEREVVQLLSQIETEDDPATQRTLQDRLLASAEYVAAHGSNGVLLIHELTNDCAWAFTPEGTTLTFSVACHMG